MNNMLYIAYLAIAAITAVSHGVYYYRQSKSTDCYDYIPAVICGIAWPFVIVFWLIEVFISCFMSLCIRISNDIDEYEAKLKGTSDSEDIIESKTEVDTKSEDA